MDSNQNSYEENKFQDKKISLIDEKGIKSTRINHFMNKNPIINQNNRFLNNNILNTERTFNDNFEKIRNESPKFFNENNNNNLNNNNINNNNINQQIEDLNKTNEELTKNNKLLKTENEDLKTKNEELKKKLEKKTKELNKLNNLFDQLSKEYSKLNLKNNTLVVYASDLQKKNDIIRYQFNDSKSLYEKKIDEINVEKDSSISLLQQEVNYYKNLLQMENNNKKNIHLQYQIQDNNSLNKKLDLLLENYSKENISLKERISVLKNELKKKNNIPETKIFDYSDFENEVNKQIDNFNEIISEYNIKLSDLFSQIPLLFKNNNKEDAAKFLVSQVNYFMLNNQKLIEENTRLLTQNSKLENELEYYKSINTKIKNQNINNFKENEDDKSIFDLNQRVDDLENIVDKLRLDKNNKSFNKNIINYDNNNINGMKEILMNSMNELKEKDKTIEQLKIKLNEIIEKKNKNFDENNVVLSMSQQLREKDTIINDLKNKIHNDEKINKYEEILKSRNEILSKINK